MYKRKTCNVWIIQQHTAYGWEDVDVVDTGREARTRRKEYKENQPELSVRVMYRRIKKEE